MSGSHIRLAMLAATALVFATGCSDDATDPAPPAALTGRVLDATGQPVAGAAIGLVYRLDETPLPGDWDKARAMIRFAIPGAGHVHLEVFDHAEHSVVVLVDEVLPAGHHEVAWDTVDSSGKPVPAGMYHYVLGFDGEPLDARDDLLYYYYELGEIMRAPHAVTDARGRFSIPRELIPTGEPVQIVDELGAITQDRIGTEVLVMAMWFEETMLISCGAVASLPPGVNHASVKLIFTPETPTPTF